MLDMTIEEMQNYVAEKLGDSCDEWFLDWLANSGYYIAPAAKSHHSNFIGGLFQHSYTVANELNRMTEALNLEWERSNSPYIVGLLHDICKLDDYSYDGFDNADQMSDVPTGTLIERIEYKPTLPGHGSKSIYMLNSRFELTEEEKACILFHMGAFTDKSEWNFYTNAVKKYPNVLYTHTADMVASQIMGV